MCLGQSLTKVHIPNSPFSTSTGTQSQLTPACPLKPGCLLVSPTQGITPSSPQFHKPGTWGLPNTLHSLTPISNPHQVLLKVSRFHLLSSPTTLRSLLQTTVTARISELALSLQHTAAHMILKMFQALQWLFIMLRATADPAHEAPRGQTLVILSELIVGPAILAPNGSSNASDFLSFQGLCPCSSTPYLSLACLTPTHF